MYISVYYMHTEYPSTSLHVRLHRVCNHSRIHVPLKSRTDPL